MPRNYSESGARPSNAGDRYHLVYVARRLLDLLHPYSELTQLVIENVSPADMAAQADPKALLGVDVTEYFGGQDVPSSEAVAVVQVKYSPLRPAEAWTPSRLTAKKRGGDSVFRKLADMFNALAPPTDSPAPRTRFTIRLLTNQPLGPRLREDLEILQREMEGKSLHAAGRALAAIRGRAGQTAQALQKAGGLSWTRLAEMLAAWDLYGFGHPSLARTEAELFEALSGFSRDGSERLEVLLGHLQVRATPGQRETLRRADVLAFLRLTEDELYPAPTVLPDDSSLFETRSAVLVRQAIQEGNGRLIIHGRSGSGKTSALRLALRDHGGGGKAVLYDCFADGRGLLPGAERFPYQKCFPQIINELDARYRTGILATVGLGYQGLLRQLDRALKAAAKAAEQDGHRLALAVDAIDNAREQERRAPPDAGTSFVPMLWQLELPSNCILIVSLRTENHQEVIGDNIPDAQRVEVTGFDEEETRHHAEQLVPSLPPEEVSFLYERTAGNPRVQRKVLEEIVSYLPRGARQLIQETARRTAFEYYDQENGRRLASAEIRRVLAVLYEMRQAPKLADVSAITELPEHGVRELIGRLSFGLRLAPGDRVAWQDQDFLDWTGERLVPEREVARAALAEYCFRMFEQDEYARWNLSYHMLQAGQLERLVSWWREPGRLDEQIRAAHPHEERVLDDLRAALLGALRIGQTREAFDLLLRAADIAEGRDAFADALADHPDVAVAADLAHLLPGGPISQGEPTGTRVRHVYAEASLNIAAELARRPDRREAAREVFARYKAAKDVERVRDPERGGGLNPAEWEIYARYQARVRGFSNALELLEERESDFWSWLFAFAVGTNWRVAGESDPLGVAFVSASLGPAERAAVTLGVLAVADPDDPPGAALRSLAPTAIEMAIEVVVRALNPGSTEPAAVLQRKTEDLGLPGRPGRVVLALGTAVENLTAAGFLEAARSLLAVWLPPAPQYQFRSELDLYLRWAAVREGLTGTIFDPAGYEPPPRPARPGAAESGERERERDEIRREMSRSYPPLRVRALAWSGAPAAEVAKEIRRLVATWKINWPYGESWAEWSYEEKAAILLESVLALPERNVPLVRETVDAAEHALGDSRGLAHAAAANVLSHDERYLGEADRLVRKELERCRPPEVPAREAMERLFYLYSPAARINASLARRAIVAAREVASEIDSRIYARAEAITAIAEIAQPDLEPELLDSLCALTCYWWSVNVQEARGPGERALTLLARKDAGAAVTRAWELDQGGLLDFEEGIGHVAVGALASRSLLPESIWPILPLLPHPPLLDTVARGSIEQLHERSCPVDASLSVYCRLKRLDAAASRPLERAQEIVAWAESVGLGSQPEIQDIRVYAERLSKALAEQGSAQSLLKAEEGKFLSRHQVPTNLLAETVSKQLPHAPRAALERLERAGREELKELGFWELGSLLSSFLDALPLSDRRRLVAVIEHWGTVNDRAEALPMLDAVLGDGGAEESDLVQVVAESIRRLLTPATLETLAITHHVPTEERTALLQGQWGSPAGRLEVILGALADHLRELGSDTLFSLASHAARLLNPADLSVVAGEFISRTAAEAPLLGNPAVPGRESRQVIPFALALALGHPRQALRWRAVYAIVHALVDTADPESFLDPLLDTLDSTDLPRWLSIREWLAFALEHVSLRKPGVLRSAVPRLVPHAVSRELPHAKIRHHLTQVLLAIEESFPGSLDPGEIVRLKKVNRPVEVVPRDGAAQLIPRWGDWDQEPEEAEDEDHLVPEHEDTVLYWYKPLVDCFVGNRTEIQRETIRSAAGWMAWLGVTRSAVKAENLKVGSRYQGQSTSNYHGSQPSVELLRLYGERHGLYLVAGELIDSIPVFETHGSEGSKSEWDDWAHDDMRGADPALPARLIDAPPPLADNYGVFSSPVDIWRKKEEPDAFFKELEILGEPSWIIVAGHREGFEYDRSFTVEVESALVSPRTAGALARLLESAGREAFLPIFDPYYACIIPKMEKELEEAELRPEPLRGEHNSGDNLFVLKAWTARFYQEAAQHGFDPLWPGTGRHYGLPALDVVRRLGWTRHPAELLWRDSTGQPVARCDLWRLSDGTGNRSAEGYRLVMRRDAVSAYARAVGLDLIFAVRLGRQSRSDFRSSGGEEYDPGTTRCFLWSDLFAEG